MTAHACYFPKDMPLELRRKLLVDVHEHAWFSVNVRYDLEDEDIYDRVPPFATEAWEYGMRAAEWLQDQQLEIDAAKGNARSVTGNGGGWR